MITSLLLIQHHKASAYTYITSPQAIGQNDQLSGENFELSTNSATGSSCPSGSYSKSTTATTYRIYRVPNSATSSFCARSYMEFNTMKIPNDAIITAATLDIKTTTVTNGVTCAVVDLNTHRPEEASASTLWGDFGTTFDTDSCPDTSSVTFTFNSAGLTAIQNSLATNNWFAVGLKANSEVRDAVTTVQGSYQSDAAGTSTNRPLLTVTFTTQKITSIQLHDGDVYDGNILTNSATGTACPSSTYTKSSTGSPSPDIPASTTNGACQRGFFEFDTSQIPSSSDILEIGFMDRISSVTNGRACEFNPLGTQPSVTSSGSTIWTDIGDGTPYSDNDADKCNTVQDDYHTLMGFTFGSQALTDLENQLGANWWGVGVKFEDEVRNSVRHAESFQDSENTGTMDVKLIVQFNTGVEANENISIVGDNTKQITIVKDDAIAIAESVTKAITILKGDAITISENLVKAISILKGDVITITEGLDIGQELVRIFNEAVQVGTEITTELLEGGSESPFPWLILGLIFGIIGLVILPIRIIKKRRDD